VGTGRPEHAGYLIAAMTTMSRILLQIVTEVWKGRCYEDDTLTTLLVLLEVDGIPD